VILKQRRFVFLKQRRESALYLISDLEGAFSCPVIDGLFPNPEDCHTFYYCVGGEAILEVRIISVLNLFEFYLYKIMLFVNYILVLRIWYTIQRLKNAITITMYLAVVGTRNQLLVLLRLARQLKELQL